MNDSRLMQCNKLDGGVHYLNLIHRDPAAHFFIHQCGIFHRDVAPHFIIVRSVDPPPPKFWRRSNHPPPPLPSEKSHLEHCLPTFKVYRCQCVFFFFFFTCRIFSHARIDQFDNQIGSVHFNNYNICQTNNIKPSVSSETAGPSVKLGTQICASEV